MADTAGRCKSPTRPSYGKMVPIWRAGWVPMIQRLVRLNNGRLQRPYLAGRLVTVMTAPTLVMVGGDEGSGVPSATEAMVAVLPTAALMVMSTELMATRLGFATCVKATVCHGRNGQRADGDGGRGDGYEVGVRHLCAGNGVVTAVTVGVIVSVAEPRTHTGPHVTYRMVDKWVPAARGGEARQAVVYVYHCMCVLHGGSEAQARTPGLYR